MMKSIKSRGGLTHGRGLTESVRLMWVHTMHKTGGVHTALAQLDDLEDRSDELANHVELGK